MSASRHLTAVFVFSGLLCAGLAAPVGAQDGLDLGLDAAGEACVAVPRSGSEGAFDVYCGAWRGPAGELSRAESLIEDCAVSELDDALLTCPGRFSGGVILDAAGSVSGSGGAAYYRGLPASAPALRRGAAVLTGASEPAPFSPEVATLLEARGTAALEDLRSLRRLGDQRNIAFEFADAVDAYSLTLTFLDGPFAGRVDQRADIALELALNLSGEGQFVAAAREFARADELINIADLPWLYIKRDNYVAAHLMNQGLFSQALRYLDSVEEGQRPRRQGSAPGGGADNEITVEESRAANIRRRPSRREASPLSISGADSLTAEQRESLLLGHRAYLRGVALDILGRDGVDESFAEASTLIAEAPETSGIWVAALLAEKRALRAIAADQPGTAVSLVEPALEVVRALAPRSPLEARLTSTLAEALMAGGDSAAALENFALAFDIFTSISQSQTGVSVERAAPYLELLLTTMNAGGVDRSEYLNRYVAAFETITEPGAAAAMTRSGARAFGDASARVEIRALQDAQVRLREASSRLQRGAATATGAELAALRSDLARAEQDVVEAERIVRAQAPEYQQLVSRQLDTAALAEALGAGEIFVAYAASARGGFGYVARADGSITPFTSDVVRAEIRAATVDLREALEEVDGLSEVEENAAAIYEASIGAARAALSEAGRDAGVDAIAYSARGAVGAVPPAILVSGETEAGGVRWMVSDYSSIVSAPSAAALIAARNSPSRESRGGLVMFGPPETPSPETLRSLVDPSCAEYLESSVYPQPITAISASDAARLGARVEPARSFTTARLTERGDLDDASVLVFSTHGFTGAQQCSTEPGLLVSVERVDSAAPSPEELAFNDPMLTASEVVRLDLDADLVVLAACDTAHGGTNGLAAAFGSEHLDGLARAFLYAGARNVLATHWPVDDLATDAFVTRFLEEARRAPLSRALNATQAYFLEHPDELTGGERTFTPALWGGFVLIGDGARGANALYSAPVR